MAAKTWDSESLWDQGGGGTVWDSMAYDPELDLLYVGTGNGFPWPGYLRSPAGGDNLFLSSILAIDPDSGRLVWHYQTTPHDSYDYTATQHMILVDTLWEGRKRKLLLQAPKNGFFYVLDRESGELLAADKFARVTWADGVDLRSGRPVFSPVSDYSETAQVIFPGTLGAHSWHPMAYNPHTGLVYIPAQDLATLFSPTQLTILLDSAPRGYERRVPDYVAGFANLLAWDVKGRGIRWSVRYPTLGNAGVLTTAGNLVVQGDAQGYVNFYDAGDGELLHRLSTRTGIVAPPISYSLDGEQYIALLAGWGGALFVLAEPEVAASSYSNAGRLLVLKLDGGAVAEAPPLGEPKRRAMGEQLVKLDEEELKGQGLYNAHCGACHGWFGRNGLLPNLRRSDPATIDALGKIVLGGLLQARGMPSFADTLTEQDIGLLQAYLRKVRLE
jgi:quinohemoprotein ethanol dehydrogenase